MAICADARRTLAALAAAAGAPWPPRPWLERLRGLRAEWEERLAVCGRDRATPIHAAAFYDELRRALPPGTLYSWDGGDFCHWGRACLPALDAGGWLRLGPLGAIGSALPNGIALQLAHPGRPVAVITGDGSLGFYLAELDTAVRAGLPIVVIVGNDAGWGLERELQRFATGGQETVACELRPTRFEMVMKGLGGEGERVETLDQLGPAVRRAFDSPLPYCIDVAIRGVRSPFTEWQITGKRK